MLTGGDPARRLRALLAAETARPVAEPVRKLADLARRRHPGTLAVLFYGSCLRAGEGGRDGGEAGIFDFYLLVERYRPAYRRRLPALANRLLPPNVFFLQAAGERGPLRAKYAVMTLRQFRAGTAPGRLVSSLWARFAQPTRLLYCRDEATQGAVIAALADAVVASLRETAPLLPESAAAPELWERVFRESYRAELRVEQGDRARALVAADRARYEAVTPLALEILRSGAVRPLGAAAARRRWALRRLIGKPLNALRLAKAVFTFESGLDYVLWKVERHSGVRVTPTAWQRRHPLLAAPLLGWQLYRAGGFR